MAWKPTESDINMVRGRMDRLAIGGVWAVPNEDLTIITVILIADDIVKIAQSDEDDPIDWEERLDNINDNPFSIDRIAYILLRELDYTVDHLSYP